MKKLLCIISLTSFILFSVVPGRIYGQIPVGFVQVKCEQPGLPIFVDGGFVGITPLEEEIQATIGSHRISFFGAMDREILEIARQENLLEYGAGYDYAWIGMIFQKHEERIMNAGTADVYVQPNKTSVATLNWEQVEGAIDEKKKTAEGFAIFFTFLLVGAVFIVVISGQ